MVIRQSSAVKLDAHTHTHTHNTSVNCATLTIIYLICMKFHAGQIYVNTYVTFSDRYADTSKKIVKIPKR